MADYELRAIADDEVDAFFRADSAAFLEEPHPDDFAPWKARLERDRTLSAFAGGRLVSTSSLFSMRLSVPGAVVPMAGVTGVGVDALHRRRGLLGRMMRGQLEAIHARGEEAISALWASEAGLYGRYGYGLATRTGVIAVRSREARLLSPPEERPRGGTPQELLDDLRRVHAALVAAVPGMVARRDVDWAAALFDPEHRRAGAGRLQAVVVDGPGGPAGYALYRVRPPAEASGQPDGSVEVSELAAGSPAASAVLWDHLLHLSLTRTVRWLRGPDELDLLHLLTDARAVELRLEDGLFVRLVDVPRALAERTYACPVDVVLGVADPVCPWNAGRWRLAGGPDGATCAPTTDPPDLVLGATELGAAHLGGTTLALLAAAGRVGEETRGALAAASRAFKSVREPWCFENF